MPPALLNNRYRIIKTLGAGGFGETFLAEDTQMPSSRRCVIKQLKPVANNPQMYNIVRDRFQREAAVLEDLGDGSNQIPRLYAYFSEAGQFYLVQEWVEGETLTRKIDTSGVMSESSVRALLSSILPVLDFVHSKRIVHRDIKPDNIILRQRDGLPVLIDFGAVKETMGTGINSTGNTASSIVIGTPGFMPSEQAAGRPMYSSDLYSLGLTAIYLLTGKWPQELADPLAGEIAWHRHALNVSPSLAAVLDKAIQFSPRERYATAREMLSALQYSGVPISPTPPSPPAGEPTEPTAAVSPRSTQTNTYTSSLGDVQKLAILGSIIGASIIVGLVVARPPQVVVAPIHNTQPRSIGWLRIGAVSKTAGFAYVGDPLIATKQPVTISPPVVPSPGAAVTVTTGVNLRKDMPRKPKYDLPEKVGVLKEGQQIIILKVDYFAESNSAPIAVWAEVGFPN
ncbi:MAG: serine/threonine protein kinase [Oscillatoria princeps RMCB-10]|jgi:serine/threonine-protein kinase|nr:serine/threonine protein kinase [Oscillatoria princeps RMCB-10]